MTPGLFIKLMTLFGFAGVLFSGYLSGVKFFTSVCAFNEPCPFFLGYPACWYGLGMFLIIFISAILGLLGVVSAVGVAGVTTGVSILGVLFAGYFTIPEIQNLLSGTVARYTLILPTCAYGLIFYIIILVLSIWFLRR